MSTNVITGASSGLGAEMARQFAARGHDLGLCARRVDRLDALRAELLAAHPGIVVHTACTRCHRRRRPSRMSRRGRGFRSRSR